MFCSCQSEQRRREAYNSAFDQKVYMNYVKGILSGLAAIFLAELIPGSWSMFKGISEQKATGLGAVAGGIMESALSPLFWTLALLIFALLFAASRLGNKILRVILFRIPTLTIAVLVMAIAALDAYVFMHFRDR
jgi:hypothetical protein